MKRLLLIVAIALLLTSCANPVKETPKASPTDDSARKDSSAPTVKVIGGDEQALRDFIGQWITPNDPTMSSKDITVYIGAFPEDMPLELPVPENAKIIGSITGSWADYILILETDLKEKATHDFYAQALEEKGWQAPPIESQGGFMSQTNSYSQYCSSDKKISLSVETYSMPDGKTNLHLSLSTDSETNICQNAPSMYGAPNMELIPSLEAPEGALIQGGGGGSSDRDAEVSASLKTSLSVDELAQHYNAQLKAAGWNLQKQGSGEGAAWSVWTFKDTEGNEWSGSLIILETSTDVDSRYALLRIERNP